MMGKTVKIRNWLLPILIQPRFASIICFSVFTAIVQGMKNGYLSQSEWRRAAMSQRRTDVSYTCGWLNETGWDPSPHHVLRGRNLTFALGDYEPFGWSDNNTANLSIGDSADHLVWQGYSVKVLEGVAKLAGFNYSIVWHGDLAQAETVYGVSTYTEFAAQIINDFDIVGSYWIDTSSRRAAGISISHHYMDASGILMVGVNTDNVSIWEEMAVIFNPFTYGLWMLIYAMVVVQAFFCVEFG
mmetsp:Transcript_10884/g.13662  ORF Transcript_10884/g.13662 Transcript_10884/m.13662 type:complete len:242 (+) Transcript_10884:58-783(+)